VNHLVEQGLIRESAEVSPKLLDVLETQIPRTVRAMIEASLERLDARQRQILEAAAAAGVEFSAASAAMGLSTAAGSSAASPADLVEEAERLCDELARRHHLLEPCGAAEWPDGTVATRYRFVHELYHNFVYEQIPIARRIRLHLSIGSQMESAWAEQAGDEAAGLAMHFERGRDWPRAVKHLRRAAESAIRQYAHREAVGYLRRALAAVERLPSADRAQAELDVLMSLGVNLQVTEGFAAAEVQEILARAYALCRSYQSTAAHARSSAIRRQTFSVLWGIWVFHKVRSDLRRAADLAGELFGMACAAEPGLLLQAYQALCMTALCMGDFENSRAHMEQAARIYSPEYCAENTASFGQDPGAATLAFGAVSLCILGKDSEALETMERAMKLAQELQQPSSLAVVTHFAAMLHQLRDEPAKTLRYAQANTELASAEKFSFWLAGGTILRGWALVRQHGISNPDAAHEAISDMRRGLSAWLATGSRTYHTYYLGLLADALLAVHQPQEALSVIEEAIEHAETLPEGFYTAELHRLKAECLLQLTDPAARASAEKAIAVARERKAALFESRTSALLARMA
jgi:predicted ATPase